MARLIQSPYGPTFQAPGAWNELYISAEMGTKYRVDGDLSDKKKFNPGCNPWPRPSMSDPDPGENPTPVDLCQLVEWRQDTTVS